MPTDLENLLARRSAILVELAAIEASKPDYVKGNQSVAWTAMRKGLMDELTTINATIAAFDGPWEIETRGVG